MTYDDIAGTQTLPSHLKTKACVHFLTKLATKLHPHVQVIPVNLVGPLANLRV